MCYDLAIFIPDKTKRDVVKTLESLNDSSDFKTFVKRFFQGDGYRLKKIETFIPNNESSSFIETINDISEQCKMNPGEVVMIGASLFVKTKSTMEVI